MSAISVGHSGKCTNCHLCLKRNAKMKHQLQSQPQCRETYTWLKEHNPGLQPVFTCPVSNKFTQRVYSLVVSKAPITSKLCNVQAL